MTRRRDRHLGRRSEAFETEYDKLNQKYLSDQLQTLGTELTTEVSIYTRSCG
ncbi:hypothetical protein ACFV9C_12870 [Kribbella sp. NPDC059898]|uniref:hypothetical protein n=1 Tax=Kribbella sp. NPDC059898 TaxID=3346995 RepID=UPI00366068FE